jgi:hypothetical protein
LVGGERENVVARPVPGELPEHAASIGETDGDLDTDRRLRWDECFERISILF